MKHVIELNDNQKIALELDMASVSDWLDNAVASALERCIGKAQKESWYPTAMVELVKEGGDPSDPLKVISKAKELGLYESALEKSIRISKEQETAIPGA